mgnify:CR=1 FL=1
MPASARKMDRLLTNKLGFKRRMGKHQIYVLKVGGRQVARTLISHGTKEIGDSLLSRMARQIGITRPQLMDILDGTLTREDYLRLLEEQGKI